MSATTPVSAWFYQSPGRECGPASSDELRAKALPGEIGPDTLVRGEGGEFCKAGSFDFLVRLIEEPDGTRKGMAQPGAPAHRALSLAKEETLPGVVTVHGFGN